MGAISGPYRAGNTNPRNIYYALPDGDDGHLAVVIDPADSPMVVAALNLAHSWANGEGEEVDALAGALREAGFVDPDDDTVPTWPDKRDAALWTSPEVLARFFLAWQATREAPAAPAIQEPARPYFGVPGCHCPLAEGSALCTGCGDVLLAEVGP